MIKEELIKYSRNGSIDALRFFMAALVVFNHCSMYGNTLRDIVNVAVPVFFAISGYFLYSSTCEKEQYKIKKAIGKTFSLYVGSLVLAFVWQLIRYGVYADIPIVELSTLWTCVNNFYPPLWYLHAYLYSMIGLWILFKLLNSFKRNCFSLSHCPLPVLISFVLVAWIGMHLFPGGGQYLYERPLLALIYVILGLVIRRINVGGNKLVFVVLTFAAVLLCMVNGKLGWQSCTHLGYHFTTLILCVFVFYLCLKCSLPSNHWLSYLGKEYALYIYIVHWVFIDILNHMHIEPYSTIFWLKPVLVLLASLFSAHVYRLIKQM